MSRQALLLALALAPIGIAAPASADTAKSVRLTAPQLLRAAERAVLAERWGEARLMLAALENAPGLAMERHFLLGYIAARTGDLPAAEREFRAVLRDRPDMTRARLELAQVLLQQGKEAAADHHYRLAEQDGQLPPEIERTIRTTRGIIRDRRSWSLSLDVALVPDSNINNATDARTIDFDFGTGPVPVTLSPDARAKSGVGLSAGLDASARIALGKRLALRLDGAADIVEHRGGMADDQSFLLAAGPELAPSPATRISLQGVAARHWFGGQLAQGGEGVRLSLQSQLPRGQRLGAQIDIREVRSGYAAAYGGTSSAAYLSYERVLRRSFIASANIFARRDDLASRGYSSKELGANIGLGGELPLGINAGLSLGLSRAAYDAAIPAFGPAPRRDWRANARAYLGARSVRVMGFSPSLTYGFARTASNIAFYESKRHRLSFALARYF